MGTKKIKVYEKFCIFVYMCTLYLKGKINFLSYKDCKLGKSHNKILITTCCNYGLLFYLAFSCGSYIIFLKMHLHTNKLKYYKQVYILGTNKTDGFCYLIKSVIT